MTIYWTEAMLDQVDLRASQILENIEETFRLALSEDEHFNRAITLYLAGQTISLDKHIHLNTLFHRILRIINADLQDDIKTPSKMLLILCANQAIQTCLMGHFPKALLPNAIYTLYRQVKEALSTKKIAPFNDFFQTLLYNSVSP